MSKTIKMNLATRKYYFIRDLMNIEKESVMDALERIIKSEKDEYFPLSDGNKSELDVRLKFYAENLDDVIDWDKVKDKW